MIGWTSRNLVTIARMARMSRVAVEMTLTAGCGVLLFVNIYYIRLYWGVFESLGRDAWRFIEYGIDVASH